MTLVLITLDGRTTQLSQAARRHGLNPDRVRKRLRRGWSEAQALGLEPSPQETRGERAAAHEARFDRALARKGDDKFQGAMLAAGYEPGVCTEPGTDNPRFVRPEVALRSRSMWDFTQFAHRG